MTSAEWKAIKVSNVSNTPLLLLKFHFTNDGYLLYLSDLATIWSENLTRKQIIRRSLDENTSIDPTESSQQYLKLLETINDGLNGKDQSSVQLYRSNAQSDDLTIFVINELPPPLSTLLWPLHLKALGREWLREKLVYPILDTILTYSQQVKQLQDMVEDKDHIISRLLDRLQATGTDLSSIFPSTSGLRVSNRADIRNQLAPYLKGLGNFERADWSVRSKAIEWNFSSFNNELRQFASAMSDRETDEELTKENALSNWTAFVNLLDSNEIEKIDSKKQRRSATPDSSITVVSSPVAHPSTALDGKGRLEKLGSPSEDGTTEKCSHIYDEKLSADKDEFCVPVDARYQGDENQSESRGVVIKRLGAIGGTTSIGHEIAIPKVATDETVENIYESKNAPTSMQNVDSHDSEGLAKTGILLLSSPNDTGITRDNDTNLAGSKVHNRIGGTSKPNDSSDIRDTLLDSSEYHASRGEKSRRQRNDSPEKQITQHVLVTPGILAEEKADRNREKLKQEIKRQHPLPAKKRRKF